jgi:hypothetical protein
VRLGPKTEARLTPFRKMYEPYVAALSRRLHMPVEALVPEAEVLDAWQSSPWDLPDRPR